jgi:hypothetical protein
MDFLSLGQIEAALAPGLFLVPWGGDFSKLGQPLGQAAGSRVFFEPMIEKELKAAEFLGFIEIILKNFLRLVLFLVKGLPAGEI